MNKKAFIKGYTANKEANALVKYIPNIAKKTSLKATSGLIASLLGGGALAGYGVSKLGAPTQADLDEEIRKMEMTEAGGIEEILEKLRSGKATQLQGEPNAGKAIYI